MLLNNRDLDIHAVNLDWSVFSYRVKFPRLCACIIEVRCHNINRFSTYRSLSVMSIKGFGLALTLTLGGTSNEMGNWITWFCVAALVINYFYS